MEPVACPRTGIPDTVRALDGGQLLLGENRRARIHGVVEHEVREQGAGLRFVIAVQGLHHRDHARGQRLERVELVGEHEHRLGDVTRGGVPVPARPRTAGVRHERLVRVDDHVILPIVERAENGPLLGGHGRAEDLSCLWRVGGHDHRIVVTRARRGRDAQPGGDALDALDRLVQEQLAGEALDGSLEVGARASLDRQPHRLAGDVQQAVVVAEAQERVCRVVEHVARRRGPDRITHRDEVPVAEAGTVALSLDEFAQGELGHGGVGEQPVRVAAEPQHVGQHPQEPGVREVLALGEDRGKVRPRPFDALVTHLYRERHVGVVGLDAEPLEEPDEVGIRPPVEDHEPAVDGELLALAGDVQGAGVAAEPGFGFVEVDLVNGGEEPGTGHATDSGPDDGNSHGVPLSKVAHKMNEGIQTRR